MVPAGLPSVLAPFAERPREAALFLDFDGTLSPIVEDPGAARPRDGVPELLTRLASRIATVAVVSGRPVSFLAESLGRPAGVHLAGLYGMEEVTRSGGVRRDPVAERWVGAIAAAARVAVSTAPPGTTVEEKGLSVTLHFRGAPDAEGWARETASAESAATGLVVTEGRMSVELRPPVGADKGDVVRRLAAAHRVVGYFGDDLGDLPAFEELARLKEAGVVVARVAVADAESPPALSAAADLVVDGDEEAVRLLWAIARSTPEPARS